LEIEVQAYKGIVVPIPEARDAKNSILLDDKEIKKVESNGSIGK